MRPEECVAHLGQLTSLPQLRIDEESGFQIVFDGEYPIDVEFDEDEDRVYVSALVLGAAQATAEVQHRALTGNGFGLMTAGAAFSLDPVTHDLLLTRAFPLAATTAEEFALALASLIDATQAWREDLRANAGTDAPPPSFRAGLDFGFIRG
ncbi:MAG TPA: type III secretion system chaperone [Geminicoccaceae bacterium]|nr:type III secretion system chaperone [Geminicoccus sp.]HMU50472.1 type III secretion system chaperone [Geminicoccaceae bacterium]